MVEKQQNGQTTPVTLEAKRFDAFIFDLDGVVTDTARLHTEAWKSLFDAYLRARAEQQQAEFQPFDPEDDYRRYVDGKPRYEGVKSFLESREIELPYGDPKDPPERGTLCGLGNKKNKLFLDILKSRSVPVFQSTVELIETLRKCKIKTAIVSSSKNCSAVLEKAGLKDLFDTRVDGVVRAKLNLRGKPAPDVFLQAAEWLDVEPARAVVVEDAISGVQAGHKGRFGLVIGVARHDNREELEENHADIVVKDLEEIVIEPSIAFLKNVQELPSALERFSDIGQRLQDKKQVMVFLDYDGTLTSIVSRPEDAVLSEPMRDRVRELAGLCPVAVISGRDLADVRKLVGLGEIYYGGSHGFDLSGPRELRQQNEQAVDLLPVIDQCEKELKERLSEIKGALVERKKFSIAVHFRNVSGANVSTVEDAVDQTKRRHSEMRKSKGKKVFELRPAIDWHKGKAVSWMLDAVGSGEACLTPLYLGDDTTDEDAFQSIAATGIGIVVETEERPTSASYRLENPEEVGRFIERMAAAMVRRK